MTAGAPAQPSTAVRRSAPLLSAYVLHSYDWSESSLILDLFTRERGRVAVAAKGAKRPYSQFRPVLLPFQRIAVALGRTPADDSAEVLTLRAAEWVGGGPILGGAALFAGFYLNELLLKMLPRQDPSPTLFDAYAAALPWLATQDDAQAQAGLRAFELRLLREAGVLPELSVVTTTQQGVRDEARYGVNAQAGVVPVGAGAEHAVDGATLRLLEAALEPELHLDALPRICQEALAPLRALLRPLLQHHLGTPVLRTRQVVQGVQRLAEPIHSSRNAGSPEAVPAAPGVGAGAGRHRGGARGPSADPRP
jgi:DNA repair protein RecO (recombination protein O)